MMEFDKNLEDRYSYPLCPQEHRWMYNKLTMAEHMGYNCAPSGTPITKPGFYCIRPIMACGGNGSGGFLKFHAKQTQTGITQPKYLPGYFWCEWFNGWHGWTNFTDDAPVFESGGHFINGKLLLKMNVDVTFKELPESLRGLSKYMLVEHIDGNIIEVCPRHMVVEYAHLQPAIMVQVPDEIGVNWVIHGNPQPL